jgi:hypothetical protein
MQAGWRRGGENPPPPRSTPPPLRPDAKTITKGWNAMSAVPDDKESRSMTVHVQTCSAGSNLWVGHWTRRGSRNARAVPTNRHRRRYLLARKVAQPPPIITVAPEHPGGAGDRRSTDHDAQ